MFDPIRRLLRASGNWLVWLSRYPYNRSHEIDLRGDRYLEWIWIAQRMPAGPGRALDFGWGGSCLPLCARWRGFEVTTLDRIEPETYYDLAGIEQVRSDVLEVDLPAAHFDLVLNCSSIEHVGLAGRYDHPDNRPDGDLEAMQRLRGWMKPAGQMLLTLPVGVDGVCETLHRVYGAERLPRLIDGFTIREEHFWIKGGDNRWRDTDRASALAFRPGDPAMDAAPESYALGAFVLVPASS